MPVVLRPGRRGALASACEAAGFHDIEERRIASTLVYADEDDACNAAFIGGPAALAWSRFDEPTRKRVYARYIESIARWRYGAGFGVPGEFVIASGVVPR